jgi:hypothetical protein
VISYLAPILPKMLDLHAESRLLSFRDASLSSLWQQLCKSDWAEGRDATPYDATFHAAEEREAGYEGLPNGETFYRSYCASLVSLSGFSPLSVTRGSHRYLQTHTKQSEVGPRRAPAAAIFSPFYLTSLALVYFDFTKLRPTPGPSASPADYQKHYAEFGHLGGDPQSIAAEQLRENDGVVPLFSQFHPFKCRWVDHRSRLVTPQPTFFFLAQLSADTTSEMRPGDRLNHTQEFGTCQLFRTLVISASSPCGGARNASSSGEISELGYTLSTVHI